MNANADVSYSVRSMFKTLVENFAGLFPAHMAALREKPDENNSNEKGKERSKNKNREAGEVYSVLFWFLTAACWQRHGIWRHLIYGSGPATDLRELLKIQRAHMAVVCHICSSISRRPNDQSSSS